MPRKCVVCQNTLEPTEQYICAACSVQLPRYPLKSIEDNELLRKAWNFAPIQYGATLLYYRHQSDFHNIIIKIKYKGEPIELTPEQEEVATFWGTVVGSDFEKRKIAQDNFIKEFSSVLTSI